LAITAEWPWFMPVRNVEKELDRLNLLREAEPQQAIPVLRKALRDRVNLVVAKAAKIAAEREVRELIPDLTAAFERLFENPVRTDPQCWAKTALAKALVSLGHDQASTFLRGARYFQLEPVWGGQEDTASALRSACVLALAVCRDISRKEVLAHIVEALADQAAPVRIDAVRALESMDGDESCLLLRLKARLGDRELPVTGQVLESLLSIEGASAIDFVADFLKSTDPELCAEAAMALASSRLPAAVEKLKTAFQEARNRESRKSLLRALGTCREPSAIEFLFGVIASGRAVDATDAIAALTFLAASADLRERARQALAQRSEPDLHECFERVFKVQT